MRTVGLWRIAAQSSACMAKVDFPSAEGRPRPLHNHAIGANRTIWANADGILTMIGGSRRQDSNPRPAVYKTAALPTELLRQSLNGNAGVIIRAGRGFCQVLCAQKITCRAFQNMFHTGKRHGIIPAMPVLAPVAFLYRINSLSAPSGSFGVCMAESETLERPSGETRRKALTSEASAKARAIKHRKEPLREWQQNST